MTTVQPRIALSKSPLLTEADVAAAVSVLRSDHLGGPDHPAVGEFEALLAAQAEVGHAVAVSSGTTALHSILLALGVGPGDEVIVPAHTFIATATPVLMVGARPVVVDIDDRTYCLDPAAVDAARSTRTRAVVAVHVNGHPAPVDELPADLPVISDACQAHGAALFGTPVGALGAAAAFSFWQDKLVTTAGEGGAVTTSDEGLAATVRLLRSHAQRPIPGTTDAHHVRLGYNYRMTGVQAAVGRSQLSRTPSMVRERRARAERLARGLAEVPGLRVPEARAGATHVYWKFVVALETAQMRGTFMAELRAAGVPASPRYPVPLTRQPVLADCRLLPCPVAEELAGRLVALPVPERDDEVDAVADLVTGIAKRARR